MGLGDFLNNVVNSIPVVGHVKGLVHAVVGDDEGAERAFQAANSCTSGVLNSIPVVGHVKAAVHLLVNDDEGAEKAFMSATRSTVVLGAAVVAGPGGAAVAAVSAGLATDTAVSVATKKPFGVVKNLASIAEAKDATGMLLGVGVTVLDVGLDAAAGGAIGNSVAKLQTKQFIKQSSKQVAKDIGKQATKDTAKQATKYIGKQVSEESYQQVAKYIAKQATNDIGKQVTKDIGKQVTKDIAKQATKDIAKQATKDIAKQATKDIAKQATKDIAKQATKDIAKQAAKDIGKQATKDIAKQVVTNQVLKSTQSCRLKNGKLRNFRPNVEYESESSDTTASSSSSDEDEQGYIYFFRCLDGTLKVGRTSHIKVRLNTHRLNGKINNQSVITVYECSDAVAAETEILREDSIRRARINRTECLDARKVDEGHVLNVISVEVSKVNRQMTQFKRFTLDKILRYFP